MPTYQYRCSDCGHDLEAVQKFSDPSLTECPSCGGHLRKVFNAVGVVFKGSGFYRTDSRAADNAASKAATKSSSNGDRSKSDGSATKTSDTKTSDTKKAETKGESKPAKAPAKATA